MINSPLSTYTKLSPNCNPRKNNVYNPSGKVLKITPHHAAGKATAKAMGEMFARPERRASSNYGIGPDGSIATYVPEDYRAWTSGNAANDYLAVTIEVANDGGAPDWHVSDKALAALINLCVDICQRNGIERLNFTGDTSGNLTMHKWFQATACPGPYLESKFPYIAAEVNKRLSAGVQQEVQGAPQDGETIYRVQAGAFNNLAGAKRRLAEVKALGYKDAFIAVVDGKLYRVQVGAFRIKAGADQMAKEIKAKGLPAIVTKLSGTPLAAAPEKTVDEIAREVIQGKWGSGTERKQRLTAAGYDYAAIQALVNKLMK